MLIVLTVVVAHCTYMIVPATVAFRIVGDLLWLGRWWCWWGVDGCCRVTFVLVLDIVPSFWSSKLLCAFPTSPSSSVFGRQTATSFRSAKGRAVVVDPVSG